MTSRTFTHALMRQAEFVDRLRIAGMPDHFYQQVVSDDKFCQWLVRWAREKLDYQETATQKRARRLMGDANFHGVPEIERVFGKMTDEERMQAEVIPDEIMTDIVAMSSGKRRRYVLEYDTGISFHTMKNVASGELFGVQNWFNGHLFIRTTEEPRWRIVRKKPTVQLPCSYWVERQELTNRRLDRRFNEHLPARRIVYTMILHFMTTGEWLFKEDKCIFTDDVESCGGNVIVLLAGKDEFCVSLKRLV